jgi:hypothetical protein
LCAFNVFGCKKVSLLYFARPLLKEKGPSLILVDEQKLGNNKNLTGDYQHYQTQQEIKGAFEVGFVHNYLV